MNHNPNTNLVTYVCSSSDDEVDVSIIASCFHYGYGVEETLTEAVNWHKKSK